MYCFSPWLSMELGSPLLSSEVSKIEWPKDVNDVDAELVMTLVEALQSCGKGQN